jgi:hypothetical protein
MIATAPAWQPILAGDEAAAARCAVGAIAAVIADRGRDAARGYDLADGAAGVALLFGYLARVTGDGAHRAVAGALLDEAAEQLAVAPSAPSLFHGFPGVAWVTDHVRSLVGEGDPALHDDIDAALDGWLASPAAVVPGFDLVTGLAGVGVYALERAGRAAADRSVDRVVARLAATARHVPGGVVWVAPPRPGPAAPAETTDRPGSADRAESADRSGPVRAPEQAQRPQPAQPDRIDLGLAHGVPGVIALLARCADRGGSTGRTARDLLDGAVRWLLTQRRGDGFPPGIVDGRPSARGRNGWCYGDAAIGLALIHASRVGDPAWFDIGLDVARRAAARPASDTGVRDAWLCHGAASLALVYQRLHHATGDRLLREAARAWVRAIFEHRNAADGHIAAPGLMNGATGAALVLLAASSDIAPDWDRALLLSPMPFT